jgi:hypothetical protein
LLVAVLALGIINIQNISTFAVSPIQIGNIRNLDDYVSGEAEFDRAKVLSLDVNWASGEVNVVSGASDKVVIKEDTDAENVEDRMCWYVREDGTLSIYSSKRSNVFFGLSFGKNIVKTLTVEIPENMSFDEFHISSASANVNADSAIADKVIVETASGNVDIKNINADKVDLTNVSGRTTIACEQAEEVSVSTVSGKTNVSGNYRELDTESVSGATEIYAGKDVDSIDCDSVSGKIDLSVSEEISGFTAKHDTVSGSFDCDFSGMGKVDKFVYGNGKTEINLETVSGSMSVKSM